MSSAEGKSSFVYVTYIRATPEKVWQALTEPEFTRQFWAGTWQECEWKVGASWRIMIPDGRVGDQGEVLEIEPHRRLVLSWRNEFKPELRAEGYSRLTYLLEPRRRHGQAHGAATRSTGRNRKLHRSRVERLAAHPGEPQEPARDRGVACRDPRTGRKVSDERVQAEDRLRDLHRVDPGEGLGCADATGVHAAVLLRPTIEIEPREGGSFILRMPDGRVDVKGKVVTWDPPRRLAVTWLVDWIEEMRDLPECLVSYDIEQAGEAVRLTMTEAHQWDVPDDLLSGGRAGWPAILSSLKSVLETGKPLSIRMEPPKEMMAALERMKQR